MVKKSVLLALAIGSLFAGGASAQSHGLNVEGVFWTPGQRSQIQISDCGNGTPCGVIIQTDENSKTPLYQDIHNPNPEMRERPILGMTMLYGFKAKGDKWKRGKIYDPTSGKTYGSGLKMGDDGVLRVKGCIGPICLTQVWEPVAPDEIAFARQISSD